MIRIKYKEKRIYTSNVKGLFLNTFILSNYHMELDGNINIIVTLFWVCKRRYRFMRFIRWPILNSVKNKNRFAFEKMFKTTPDGFVRYVWISKYFPPSRTNARYNRQSSTSRWRSTKTKQNVYGKWYHNVRRFRLRKRSREFQSQYHRDL